MSNCYHYKIVGNDNFDNCLFLVVVFCHTRICRVVALLMALSVVTI